jgi:putative PIN family toxin of toxin-antitoxin system
LAVNQQLIRMCISQAVLAEYEEVLRRPRLKFTRAKIENTLARIIDAARMVYPAKTLNVSGHGSDNRFYECAEAAMADYLITGNIQDFTQDHGPTRIITPRDFIEQVVPGLLKGEP